MRERQRCRSSSRQQREHCRQLQPRRLPRELLLGALLLAALLLHSGIVNGLHWKYTQVRAIEDLRLAMNTGGQTFNPLGWNAKDDCRMAQVLRCDTQGMVTSMNLAGAGKLGSIPSSIGALSRLTSVVLRGNAFSNQLPGSLNSLTKLVQLDLSDNTFSGIIPSFSSLIALTYLNLSRNSLAGPIPDCFDNLASLQTIDLSTNQLSGSLPASMSSLGALKTFRADDNYLSGKDPPFSVCGWYSYNASNGCVDASAVAIALNCFDSPYSMGQQQREADQCTAFCGIEPRSTSACGGHGYCYWEGSGASAQGKCVCEEGTSYVGDRGACVTSTGTPWDASQLPFLKELRNSCDQSLGWEDGDDCKTAKYLTCDDDGMITGLLNLTDAGLIDSIPSALFTLPRLTQIIVSSDEYLSCSLPQSISLLTDLVGLELSIVNLANGIPTELFTLTSLTRIKMEGHFGEFGSIREPISMLTNLVELELSKAIFTGGIPSGLFTLPSLTRIVFYDARLSDSLPAALSTMKHLKHLDLRYNHFVGPFPDVKGLTSLTYLDLAYNFFAGTIPMTASMSSLKNLDLNFNFFTSGTIEDHICNQANVADASNCLNPYDVPCQQDDSQLQDCSIFCGMDASSSIPPCAGRGYCYGEFLNAPWWEQSEMQCQCLGGYTQELTSGSCVPTLESSQVDVLSGLLGLWGSAPNPIWKNETLDTVMPRVVAVDAEQFIINLDLSNQSLNGTIPSILSTLARLTHLNLSRNEFSGAVPKFLSSLLRMETLDLSYNQLSGPVPSFLRTLRRLETLDVSNNYLFSGSLPTTMCTSSVLQNLSLRSNCLPTDAIPCALDHTQRLPEACSAFCGFSSPSTLPCSGRGYCYWDGGKEKDTAMCACEEGYGTGVLPGTCAPLLSQMEWAVLDTLTAAWGGFDGDGTWKRDIPCGRMHYVTCDPDNRVEQLNVSGLGIRGFIPDAISGLASLTVLDLSQNYLSGALVQGLSTLLNLDTLNLSNNYLYSGTLPKATCDALNLSLQSNCFNSSAMPCALTHIQRSPQQCSTFCGLSPPSTSPCDGRGDCYWKKGEETGTATCACEEGYGNGADPRTCINLLPELEWLALGALKVAWGGFDGEGTWDQNTSCVRMKHVKCNEDNHIVDLNVFGLEIAGSIPSDIQGLSHLTSLNVSNNAIAGRIPDSISRLTKLKLLDLSHNQLSGALPSGLNNLQGLNGTQGLLTLSVHNNYLYSSSLTTTMCSSLALKLSLQNNCFDSSAMPCALTHTQRPAVNCSAFCSLKPPTPPCPGHGYCLWKGGEGTGTATCSCGSDYTRNGTLKTCDGLPSDSEWAALEALKMAWRTFTEFSTWKKDAKCGDMKHITCDADNHIVHLEVTEAEVPGSIPALIGNLIYLTALKLSGNHFRGSLPSTVGQLTNLVEWDLRYNSFTGSLPKSISAMQRLETLDFDGNSFKGHIPEGICSMTNVTKFTIAGNSFDGPIPGCVSNLASLKILDMSYNRMSGKLPSLRSLKKLGYLDLSNNRFSGSIPSDISTLKALRSVNLDYNKLSGVLVPLSPIVALSARYNYLSAANSLSCKNGRLANNCLLKKKRICSKFPQRPMRECTPFCGLSRKSHPCGGVGGCVLVGRG
ncbi:hypothetical protein CLOM_g14259 [Closterium sp. NIES-68]|nr:hypothetical protein CLOM_g14259 [Closterium sp. NIES-68]GJP59106.1 hypothetical protein CLOP_g7655 [Closterium sp. NIES-67]